MILCFRFGDILVCVYVSNVLAKPTANQSLFTQYCLFSVIYKWFYIQKPWISSSLLTSHSAEVLLVVESVEPSLLQLKMLQWGGE